MTIQEKKNYLKQYKRLTQKIVVLEKELRSIRLTALPGGIDYAKDKIQTSATSDQMVNYMVKLDDLERTIQTMKLEAAITCENIIKAISCVENETYQTLLHRRYILLEQWEEIADVMGYSIQWVYLTHGEALAELNINV